MYIVEFLVAEAIRWPRSFGLDQPWGRLKRIAASIQSIYEYQEKRFLHYSIRSEINLKRPMTNYTLKNTLTMFVNFLSSASDPYDKFTKIFILLI